MDFKSFKKNSAKWNLLAGADTLGSFDFMTLMVTLDSLTIEDFEKLGGLAQQFDYRDGLLNRTLNQDLYLSLKQVYGLALHEYTHFIDSTSTVWGIEFLNILNEAYLSNHDIYKTEEPHFYKAKLLRDLLRSIKLPDYYTSIEQGVNYSTPWEQYLTVGRKFDFNGYVSDIPIPFISFRNTEKKPIVRSPLSLIALLEISATAQEFLYKTLILHALPEDQRLVEKQLVERDALKFMYNPNLTEYTACAHLAANALGYPDIYQSYKACERISTLVLNLTDAHFERIQFTELAKSKLNFNLDPQFMDSIYRGIKYKDRGFLFLIICQVMGKLKDSDDIETLLQNALKEIGLDYYLVLREARRHVELEAAKLKTSPFKMLAKLSSSAIKNFDQKITTRSGMYDFSSFDLPPAMFGDCEIRNICSGINNSLEDFDIWSSYLELHKGQQWVDKFSDACI